jgi:hypothetical protein
MSKKDSSPKAMDPALRVAIIAASVATVVSEPHRIVQIRPIAENEAVDLLRNPWATEGRRQIYASHRIRS